MRAEDLMIGDWVRIIDDDTDAYFDARIEGIDVLSNIHATMPCDETGYPYSVDCAQPIPLTPEILEKNFQEFLPGINLMYQLKGPYCAMNEDGQWVFGLVKVDGEKSARYPLVKISFVHELQHALRLCGITKEIQI